MRILLVNKYNYARGGADVYFLFLQKALVARGHEVAIFAMEHPKNESSPWEKYFVSRVSFNEGGIFAKLKAAGRMLYSFEAARKFDRLLADFCPDIIHGHNIYHQLSPSILVAAKKRHVPFVMHLHDYKLISANYNLFVNGQIYLDGVKEGNYWPGLRDNFLGSYSRSLMGFVEMTLHHKIFHFYEDNLDLAIAPSRFMHDLVVAAGWPENKITTLINPAPEVSSLLASSPIATRDNYFLYFGRLFPEKGVADLLAAARSAGVKVHVAGAGSLADELKSDYQAEIQSGLFQFLGQRFGASLQSEIDQATAVVIPSRWLENMPLALLESIAAGKIVLASRIGGMPEIIKDKENGFLFEPGNIQDLQSQLEKILVLTAVDRDKLQVAAQTKARSLNPEKHLSSLIAIYQKVLKKGR